MQLKQPIVKARVQPKVLYNTDDQKAKVVKVHSPFEYLHYIRRRQEYMNKQQELLLNLQLSKENYEKLTFSVKQIGVTDSEGRFGIQSQRRYLLNSMEASRQHNSQTQQCQTERVSYQFKAKALPSSRRETYRTSTQLNCFIPERPQTHTENRGSQVDKILKRSRQKKQRISQQSPPEIVFGDQLPRKLKFSSYSRQLQELSEKLDFNKLL